jgi:hypothetical protein
VVLMTCGGSQMFPSVPSPEQVLCLSDHLSRWLGAGNTLLVHLYKNNLVPAPSNILADFVEVLIADWPGYAPIAITTSGSPFIGGDGNAAQIFSDPVFQPSADPGAPVTVFGYFVTIHPVAGPDTLLYSKRFDTPPIITTALQAVTCDPDVSQAAFTSPRTE